MKSVPYGAGNIKMRGKKTKLLYCRCCVAVDFREGYFNKLAKQGIHLAKRTW